MLGGGDAARCARGETLPCVQAWGAHTCGHLKFHPIATRLVPFDADGRGATNGTGLEVIRLIGRCQDGQRCFERFIDLRGVE
jgi:hypothetical protein